MFKCDRCGKVLEDTFAQIEGGPYDAQFGPTRIQLGATDLCQPCEDDFAAWVKAGIQ